MNRSYTALLALFAASSAFTAHAQLKGDHLLGDYGLNAGTQAPPSIIAALPFYWYDASKLVRNNGERINAPDLNVYLMGVGASVVTNLKILNANYGASLLIPFMSNRIEGNVIQSKTSLGFTDMYVQPVQLGWHTQRADFLAGYGIYMPTGKYEYGGRDNKGMGMWTHEFSAGTTLFLDAKKTWNLSTIMFYEIHSKKKDTTAKTGDIISLEGGIGKAFYKKIPGAPIPMVFNVGMIYYMQFKVSSDKIPVRSLVFTGNKDRIYALGLEANFFYPKTFTSVSFRWLGEFEARNRFQGNTFFVTVGQFLKSLSKKKEQE